MGFSQAQLRRFFETLRAQRGEMHRRPQCQEALIRADVTGGAVTGDMLLAGLEREHPAAFAIAIDGLTLRFIREGAISMVDIIRIWDEVASNA